MISSSRASDRAIAILSYDKRGVGKSQPADHDKNHYYRAGVMDFMADAVEEVRFVSCDPQM